MLKRLLTLFLSCQYSVRAEQGIFYNPPTGGPIHVYKDNPAYELEQMVQLRWATSLESISIMLWQDDNPHAEWLQTNLSDVTTYNWIVSTQRNLDDGNVFFFQIRDADETESPDFFGERFDNDDDDVVIINIILTHDGVCYPSTETNYWAIGTNKSELNTSEHDTDNTNTNINRYAYHISDFVNLYRITHYTLISEQ
ncbi:hypothetical protein BDV40DRAFT_305285 [Aspergillus tamarii]|uniref:Uncharacterized protein n=1 Tax=Aspergillus tamarii TaxID=41984 RepID=A0A5N6UFB5_ASPTM|nr:hypothetical protein BDV40DRAFT_305285 [Aspergillus tamarii]